MFNISIIGLGYVGLPLAIELSRYFKVIGFDLNKNRIKKLKYGIDSNNDVKFKKNHNLNIFFTSKLKDLKKSDTYIITVPTPILKNNNPDLYFLKKAFIDVSNLISKGNLIILESTVYPGLTEKLANLYFSKKKGLKINHDFYLGYSPERINPGDNEKKIKDIKKIIASSDKSSLKKMNIIYSKIIKAGLFKAKNIKIAESAKVIENAQRDINIAFVNELYKIFDNLDIDINDVLEAASTKWNFLNFKPGLVGGHCIGVDPFYLTYLSKQKGYDPKVILSGRKVNDSMHNFIINSSIKKFKSCDLNPKKMKVLLLGFSFKENCSDIRNSKIFNLYSNLKEKINKLDVYDPYVDKNEVLKTYNLKIINTLKKNYYDAIYILLSHKKFKNMGYKKIRSFGKKKCVVYDLKNVFLKGNYSY